jgi:glucose-6-phosphate dehydrogenase assembly protein OpcA
MTADCKLPDAINRPVALHDIETALNEGLRELQDSENGAIYRCCMSNLIVYCDQGQQADQVSGCIATIAALHPARVILLVAQGADGEDGLEAFVRVGPTASDSQRRCWLEQVTLHARGHTIERLPYCVRSLVIGDLPTNVWWATPRPPGLAGPILYELAESADQIIYDSIGWLEPARGVAGTATWIPRIEGEAGPRHAVVSDLNWRRLKSWRRLLAQALDPNALPDALATITGVEVDHGPHAVVQAWELVSWLAARLGWRVQAGRMQQGVEIAWKAESPRRTIRISLRRLDHGPAEIKQVRLAWDGSGGKGAIRAQVEDGYRLSVIPEEAGAAPRTLTVRPLSTTELVAKQLSDRKADPAFRRVMEVAQVLARSLLH